MRNKKGSRGVTLIEVLIAMTVLLIVFMGLIQASIVALNVNMRNEIRDEAVRLSSDQMNMLRTASFDDDDLDTTAGAWDTMLNTGNRYTRQIRNATVTYTVQRQVADLDADHKQITLRTTWVWQGEPITHTIDAFRGRT